jgi:hypothetical protein
MKPWHRADPARFEEFKRLLAAQYPTLHVHLERGRVFVRGTLLLREAGVEIDHYQIELEIPDRFPEDLPIVREVGGGLPKIADRHFNPENSEACVLLPDERYKYLSEDISIIDFIKGPVENFFLSQTYYDRTGKWLNEPWPHAAEGIREYYGELLGTTDDRIISTCVQYLSRKTLKGHWPCYCGSGKPLRYCHLETIRDLRSKISQRVASKSLQAVTRQPSTVRR